MGYSLKSLKAELTSRQLADDGLVAWGQSSTGANVGGFFGGAIGGAIGAAVTPMYAITMIRGSQIAIFPFTNKEIRYNEAYAFNKNNIERAKLSGLISKTLTIITTNGQKHKYPILQGSGDVKKIFHTLGL